MVLELDSDLPSKLEIQSTLTAKKGVNKLEHQYPQKNNNHKSFKLMETRNDSWPESQVGTSNKDFSLLKSKPSTNFRQFYKPIGFLGRGGFGKVYFGQNLKNSSLVAIKCFQKKKLNSDNGFKRRVKREILIHSQLKHANIVPFLQWLHDDSRVYLILEVCSYGDMVQYIKHYPRLGMDEDEVRLVLDQVISALKYLHEQHIIHRDLKLSNLLIKDSRTVMVSDFGLATYYQPLDYKETQTLCGTLNYLSPEIIRHQPYTLTSDLWSLGCLSFTMLCGRSPFENNTVNSTLKRITEGEFHLPDRVSDQAKKLVKGLLRVEPKERLSLDKILKMKFLDWQQNRKALDKHVLNRIKKVNLEINDNIKNSNDKELDKIILETERNKSTDNTIKNNSEEDNDSIDERKEMEVIQINTTFMKPFNKSFQHFNLILKEEDGKIYIQYYDKPYYIEIDQFGTKMDFYDKKNQLIKSYTKMELPKNYFNIYKVIYQLLVSIQSQTTLFEFNLNDKINFKWMLNYPFPNVEMYYNNEFHLTLAPFKKQLLIQSLDNKYLTLELEFHKLKKELKLDKVYHKAYLTFLNYYTKGELILSILLNKWNILMKYSNLIPYKIDLLPNLPNEESIWNEWFEKDLKKKINKLNHFHLPLPSNKLYHSLHSNTHINNPIHSTIKLNNQINQTTTTTTSISNTLHSSNINSSLNYKYEYLANIGWKLTSTETSFIELLTIKGRRVQVSGELIRVYKGENYSTFSLLQPLPEKLKRLLIEFKVHVPSTNELEILN